MRIINIIESTRECPVLSIKSFAIYEEQLSGDVVAEAEQNFIDKGLENGIDLYEMEEAIEDGFMVDSIEGDDYTISIVWSHVD